MRFGICTSIENSATVKAAGWDFIEERVDLLLQGTLDDAEWTGAQRAGKSALPILAANVLVPGTMKITGSEADLDKLREYMTRVLVRAGRVGIRALVFGSGGARNVPEGFDRQRARAQIVEFLRMVAPVAQEHRVTILVEHLNRKECNIITSVAEAMTYVRDANHPNVRCLVDSYHFWLNEEPLESLDRQTVAAIEHVHVADKDGRLAPGLGGKSDYAPFFGVLKRGGYDGNISVEAKFPDLSADAPRVLDYLKQQWNDA
jgi:sugar phosphate isomerase/epimerase